MLASVKFRIQVLILNYDENCNNKKACCYKVHRPHRKNIHPSEVNQDTLVSMNCEASLNSAVLQPCALWRGTMRYRELKLLSHTLQQPIRLEQTCGAVQPIPRVNWQPAIPRQGIVWKNNFFTFTSPGWISPPLIFPVTLSLCGSSAPILPSSSWVAQ